LRLDCNHPGANPAEHAHSVADMCTYVKRQITGVQELPVETLHPAPPPDRAVVGDEGTAESGRAAEQVCMWHKDTFTSPSNTMGGSPHLDVCHSTSRVSRLLLGQPASTRSRSVVVIAAGRSELATAMPEETCDQEHPEEHPHQPRCAEDDSRDQCADHNERCEPDHG